MFKNMKISQKLMGAAIIMSAIVALVGLAGILNAQSAADGQQEIINKAQPLVALSTIQKAYSFDIMTNAMGVLTQAIGFGDAQKNVENAQNAITKARQQVKPDLLSNDKPESSQSGFNVGQNKSARELWTDLEKRMDKTSPYVDKLVQVLSADSADASSQLNEFVRIDMYPQFTPLLQNLQKVIDQQIQATIDAKAAAKLQAQNTQTIIILIVLVVIAMAVAFGLMFFLARSIRKPLNELVDVAQTVARDGDIRRQVGYESKDEIGQVAEAFRELGAYLNEQAAAVTDLSKGDVSHTVEVRSDYDVLGKATITAQTAIGTLVNEASNLSLAAGIGDLATRMDESTLQGAWAEIAGGMNMAMTSIEGVFADTKANLNKLADKDLTARIEGDYPGDYGDLKENFNTALNALGTGFRQVAGDADSIASVSSVLQMSADALANSASLQSYSVEAISGSMEEINAAAADTAMNAAIGVAAVQEAQTFVDTSLMLAPEGELTDLLGMIKDKVTTAEGYVNDIAAAAAKQSEQITAVGGSLEQIRTITDDVAKSADESAKAVGLLASQADGLAELSSSYSLPAVQAAPAPAEGGSVTHVEAEPVPTENVPTDEAVS